MVKDNVNSDSAKIEGKKNKYTKRQVDIATRFIVDGVIDEQSKEIMDWLIERYNGVVE